jgi:hypothetical protein
VCGREEGRKKGRKEEGKIPERLLPYAIVLGKLVLFISHFPTLQVNIISSKYNLKQAIKNLTLIYKFKSPTVQYSDWS